MLERCLLARCAKLLQEVQDAYAAYNFSRAFRLLEAFGTSDLSSIYCDLRKDILYCHPKDAPERRAVLSCLHWIYRGLLTHYAPILPFTCEEAWQHLEAVEEPKKESVHLQTFTDLSEFLSSEDEERWQTLLALRQDVYVPFRSVATRQKNWL